MHDYKLNTSLKIGLLVVNHNARTPFIQPDNRKMD